MIRGLYQTCYTCVLHTSLLIPRIFCILTSTHRLPFVNFQVTLWLARAAVCPCIAEGVKQGNLILYNIRTTLVTAFNQSKDRNGLWTLWSFVVICYSLIDIINYFALTLSHLKTLFIKISVTPYHIFWPQNLLGLCNISHSNFTDHLNFTK